MLLYDAACALFANGRNCSKPFIGTSDNRRRVANNADRKRLHAFILRFSFVKIFIQQLYNSIPDIFFNNARPHRSFFGINGKKNRL